MKKFIILLSIFFAVAAHSQSLRVTFNGNRDFQLVVDGKSYNSSNYLNSDVVLNNLSGDHNVSVYRTNKRGIKKQVYGSTINLSQGEEVHLIINSDGSIERSETSSNAAYGTRTAISEASFNEVLKDIRNQWGQANKMEVAREVLGSGTYQFSSDQAMKVIRLISSEANRLELAKLVYNKISDPQNFYRVQDLLRSQASRNELNDYIRDNESDSYKSYKVAMTDASFNQLYQSIRNQRTNAMKLSAATKAFNSGGNFFTAAQISEIISLFTGDNNRLQLAKLAIDNLESMENVALLFDLLISQTAKEQLDDYIRNNGFAGNNYNYTINAAMSDAEFTAVYNEIRSKWLPLGKYNAAIDVFSSASNRFTTAQVKQIINLLSSESNRMDLAKLAYDNVVDSQNYRDLYDLFPTQQSRDELDNFIRNNTTSQY